MSKRGLFFVGRLAALALGALVFGLASLPGRPKRSFLLR
jgi:hypothetical protein